MDLQGLILFLQECGKDERFTADAMMPEIEKIGDLNVLERLLYRYVAIPQTREALLAIGNTIAFTARQPDRWGPGRVDTFNPYKALQLNFPMDKVPDEEIIGVSDLPSIWQQRKRIGMELHWDGNNDSVEERNKSAALGAGVTPATIGIPRIERIEEWLLDLEPPGYPYSVNGQLAAQGKALYERDCADCHGKDGRNFEGKYVGKVADIADIGTDPHRLDSYSSALVANQNTLYAGYPWRFKRFKKTNGYSNLPLDGIWLRGPYLHNGSVPTLRDLLNHPDERPQLFYRGYDVIDREKVGFVSNVAEEGERHYFKYDTQLAGNGNQGHLYGIELSAGEKDAVVEYMKQF